MIKSLEEFKIDNIDFSFRFKKIKPTKLLSLSTQLGSQNLETNEQVYDFILENTEVKVEGTWTTIKEKEVFFPPILEERLDILQSIVVKFIGEFLTPVFTKSVE